MKTLVFTTLALIFFLFVVLLSLVHGILSIKFLFMGIIISIYALFLIIKLNIVVNENYVLMSQIGFYKMILTNFFKSLVVNIPTALNIVLENNKYAESTTRFKVDNNSVYEKDLMCGLLNFDAKRICVMKDDNSIKIHSLENEYKDKKDVAFLSSSMCYIYDDNLL